MKVLLFMVSPGTAKGGMEKHYSELANGLASSGIQVFCMAAPEHLQALDANITRLPINSRLSRHSVATYFRVARILREYRFDVVHAQGSKAAHIVQRISPLFKKTVFIATIHNFKKRYPNPLRFCRMIAVSNALARDIGHSNVTVVYNGLDTQAHASPAGAISSGDVKPVWLSVGRLVAAKGFDRLIEAFQHVKGTLLIAGSGPNFKNLDEQIHRLNLSGRVKLLGHVTNIPELMSAVDAVVISSRREGFSYVFAEALQSDKPVVATDVPIANEFLPGDFVIPTNASSEEFADHLNINLASAYNAQASARTRAQAELSVDAMTKNTVRVYRDCLEP
ncbi:glycosyltransferase [Marinobacter sp. LQ44]|uniref:glycosyltransferase n=1 Tax=unclassified Marinobacter TaxID=83889 RepID=UPI000718BBA5|nr:glycosyltransferase [Marinobacter sp. LQ44]AMQ89898.1 hypothetical protein ASQ50_15045 [Marinobacter sp. LQ44]